ncbi:MAG: tetratricopeptide repeat protein [Gammaproteobacteria bacterium]
MRLIRHTAVSFSLAAGMLASGAAMPAGLQDPYFGEALYYAHQGHYFEALERLDTELAQHWRLDEPARDTLYPHIGDARFSVGDFELRYRMHHRAGRAIRAVLEGDVAEPVRNDAAFRLARIHFQKGQYDNALTALDRIEGEIPEDIRDDIEFLRANVYLALGQPSRAVSVLEALRDEDGLDGFAAFNLGIALLQDGRQTEALEQLERAGRITSDETGQLAIRDKSNFARGNLLFEASSFDAAQASFNRVRMEGPYSNVALLRAGWADASGENFRRALVPWGVLAKRQTTDAAVQEAMLALPYAYSRLEVHGRAAVLYGRAVQVFGEELEKVDASIRSIREGQFLEALAREEIRQNKDWVIRLRQLPETPETFYLMSLMASHDFQTALQNYLDLEDLRKKLSAWESSFDAFDDILRIRRAYYEPLLPEIDSRFRELDAQIRLRMEQRERIDRRLKDMLVAPRPEFLATAEERVLSARIADLRRRLDGAEGSETEMLQARLARVEGALTWRLETEYHQRFTEAHENLAELNVVVDRMKAQHEAFVRTRQAALHSYEGYDIPIKRLRTRVAQAQAQLKRLMGRQGHLLETVAIRELEVRRDRLHAYQSQARYAFADSYDRAAKAQADAGAAEAAAEAGVTEGEQG